jgi:hypothetical protein
MNMTTVIPMNMTTVIPMNMTTVIPMNMTTVIPMNMTTVIPMNMMPARPTFLPMRFGGATSRRALDAERSSTWMPRADSPET